jgi:RNA polymerase sigma factor for flagellar operon FliA
MLKPCSGSATRVSPAVDLTACAARLSPLVKRIARGFSRLPVTLDENDLVQLGMLGLIQAVRRHDRTPARSDEFFRARIRGAMLDGMRASDTVPRRLRRLVRHMRRCQLRLEQVLLRPPSGREVAEKMRLTLRQYQHIVDEFDVHRPLYGDPSSVMATISTTAEGPLQTLERTDSQELLHGALHSLPGREQAMLRLHYDDDMPLHVIGAMFDVSESRVSQLLTHARARLRSRIRVEFS